MFQYPYGDSQQLNLDWLMEQWLETKASIDGSLQGEIDRVEAAITDLLTARDQAVAARTAAEAAATSAAGYAGTASTAASTATAQAAAAAASAALAGNHASNAQTSETNAGLQATAAGNSASTAAVSATNARNSELAAAASSSAAAGNALYAEGYAKGTQNGNPVSSGSPYYENNAKYYADQAAQDASDAADSAQDAQDAATLLQPPATNADIGKALIVKTVGGGTVTSYELGESGGGGGTPSFINTIENVPIASFDDGTVNPVHQLVVDIVPVQSGSGDPSPINIRPITGWTGANIYSSGADTSNPTTHPITFPPEAGTVYGGTIDITGGKLISNWINITINGTGSSVLAYGSHLGDNACIAAYTGTRGITRGKPPICDTLPTGATNDGTYDHVNAFDTGNVVQFILLNSTTGLTSTSTREEINAAFNTYFAAHPAQVVYQIGTDTEYQISPEEISTLSGDNNIWADTGNINLLQYYADSKRYIDEQDVLIKTLIAPVLDNMIADTALTANDFRIVENTLYKITASVAAGAALTPNTNCTATTITDVLKALL